MELGPTSLIGLRTGQSQISWTVKNRNGMCDIPLVLLGIVRYGSLAFVLRGVEKCSAGAAEIAALGCSVTEEIASGMRGGGFPIGQR